MKKKHQLLLLFILCICTFFVHLDNLFPQLMEARNFITAREMLEEGNWWYTTMNLNPRLEKPPLPTWLTAISALCFGGLKSLWVLRLPSALVSMLMVFFFYRLCEEISKEKFFPILAASMLATSLLIIEMARQNTWDIYTHAFMIGSIWQLLKGIKQGRIINPNILWAAILFGLSVLSKGPVSLYALWLPFVIAYGIGFKSLQKHWKQLTIVFLLGCLIGFFWNVSTLIYQEEAAMSMINQETGSWIKKHVRPFYYYLNFPIFLGVWAVFLLPALIPKYAKSLFNQVTQYKFVIVWLFGSLILLSVIPEKKERYLLPAVFPMCIAAAYILYGILNKLNKNTYRVWDYRLMAIFTFVLHVSAIALPIFVFMQMLEFADALEIITSTLIAVLGIIGIVLFVKKRFNWVIANVILIISLFMVGLLPSATAWHYNYNFSSLSEIQDNQEIMSYPFYVQPEPTDMRLVWLCGKATKPIERISLDDPSNFPLVFISFDSPESQLKAEELKNIEITNYGEFDIRRKKVPWRPSVYMLKFKK